MLYFGFDAILPLGSVRVFCTSYHQTLRYFNAQTMIAYLFIISDLLQKEVLLIKFTIDYDGAR